MKKRLVLWGMSMVMLSACGNMYSPPAYEDEAGEIREDALFIGTENEDGTVTTRFSTNNGAYWSLRGYSVWTIWEEGAEGVFREREAALRKSSGSMSGGYGLVLCQGQREVGGEMKNTMFIIMINNEGKYFVGKVLGAQCQTLQWWTVAGELLRGNGKENRVKVIYEGERGEYRIFFNGRAEAAYVLKDENEPVLEGGKNGYVVVISGEDRFPGDFVDVSFQENR